MTIYSNIIIYHGSTTCLVLRRRAHLMDQFDRVFNGFVKHFPFALLETVFGISLRTIDEQRPSAKKYEDKTRYNAAVECKYIIIIRCKQNKTFIALSSIK